MKKLWWISRIAALSAALYCIAATWDGPSTRPARAADCDTSRTCEKDTTNNSCLCRTLSAGGDCTGCYTQNDVPGCGNCDSHKDLDIY